MPLRVVAVPPERPGHDGIGNAQRHGHGGVHAGDFFEHEHVGDRVERGAAPFFWNQHAAAAEFAEAADFRGGEFFFAIVAADVRADFGVHETADIVSNHALVVGEGEVHKPEERR